MREPPDIPTTLAETRRAIILLVLPIAVSMMLMAVGVIYLQIDSLFGMPEYDLGWTAWCVTERVICTRDGYIGGPETAWQPARCPCEPNIEPVETPAPRRYADVPAFLAEYTDWDFED